MAFHGGLAGVLLAMGYFARKTGRTFFQVADFIAPWTPIGLGLGRLGNFINHELWGKVSDVPWAMVFRTGGPDARHPSQLYQLALEGIALFVILWWFSRGKRPAGSVSGVFLVGYGVFRFVVEFVREPDPQLGYLAFGWLTMGQVLSLPMIVIGIGLLMWAYRKPAA
jgi:phosphatidylglycerol:prolipoprotein diacylglycerol transferase